MASVHKQVTNMKPLIDKREDEHKKNNICFSSMFPLNIEIQLLQSYIIPVLEKKMIRKKKNTHTSLVFILTAMNTFDVFLQRM